ncbi:PAS domain-containing protein [Streptomyces flavidovirens]|uniref:PAS domain-containing protein n=1 Tax=Streptomyces flavidovirens TaxID=67298 RepID=UPI00041A11C4|nr:PAS domain-containing protein [Streptomyces flavidovirens]
MSSRPSRGAARLAAILDALPDGLLLVNCNGTVVNANTIALETFESPGTGLVGRGLLDLLPMFDSKLIPGSMRRADGADDQGRTKPTRMIARRTDGTEFPVEVTSANLEDGRDAYASHTDRPGYTGDELLMLVVRDLSGTVDTEAELARSQRQTEMILRAASEGVVGTDTDGRVVLVNPAAAQILGYRASDLGGKELHPLAIHSKGDGTPFPYEDSPLADTLKSGRKHRVRGQVLWAKNGKPVAVDLTTAPVRDGDQLVGAVMTFTDRRPYDELVEKQAEVLEREAKRYEEMAGRHAQLTAVLGDSLRGPLEELRGELGTLASDPAGQLWPEANQILHHLAAGYARMTTLVDNVLGFQRLAAGTEQLTKTKVLLDGVVAAGVEGAIELIGPGRAQFAVHAPPIEAEVDAGRLATALAHLVADVAGIDSTGKAPAAAPGGGYTDSTIVVAAAQRGDVVRIEVRGPYAGGDPVHEPIVRGIVAAHGGVLQTHEVPGMSGSAYVLEVPLGAGAGAVAPAQGRAAAPDPAPVPTRQPAPADGGGRRARRSSTDAFLEADGKGAAGEQAAGAAQAPADAGSAGPAGSQGTVAAPTGRRRARPGGPGEAGAGGARERIPAQAGGDGAGSASGAAADSGGTGRRRGRPSPVEGGGEGRTGGGGGGVELRAALPAAAAPAGPTGAVSEGSVVTASEGAHGTGRAALGETVPPQGVPVDVPGSPGRRARRGEDGAHGNVPALPALPSAPSPGNESQQQQQPQQTSGRRARRALAPAQARAEAPRSPFALPPADADRVPPAPGGADVSPPGRHDAVRTPPDADHTPPQPHPTPAPTGRRRARSDVQSGQPVQPDWAAANGTPRHGPATPAPAGAALPGAAEHASGAVSVPPTWSAVPSGATATTTGTTQTWPAPGFAGTAVNENEAEQHGGAAADGMADAAGPNGFVGPKGPNGSAGAPGASGAAGPNGNAPRAAGIAPVAAPANSAGWGDGHGGIGPASPNGAAGPNGNAPRAPGIAPVAAPANSAGWGDGHAAIGSAGPNGAAGTPPPAPAPAPAPSTGQQHPGAAQPLPPAQPLPAETPAASPPSPAAPATPAAPAAPAATPTPGQMPAPMPAPTPPPPPAALPADASQGRAFSVRTLGQGMPFAQQVAQQQNQTLGSGRRRKLAAARPEAEQSAPAEGTATQDAAEPGARPHPQSPQSPQSPHGSLQQRLPAHAEGRAYAIGAPDEGSEGPEPLDGPNGAVEVANRPQPQPVDDELPPEPLDNPRRLLVWPAPDVSTQQALSDRGYRPVIVHSREEVDAQIAAFPAALFVDPLTGPITRTALQSLRQAAVAAEVPVLVTAGLGQATREAAYGADPAVLLKALAPRDSEQHPSRVLLIEEHEEIALALTATLERRGMQVGRAGTDTEAVTLATQMRPNLVVMDLMQVRRRRAGIIDWLRANGQLNRTPLVVYTSAGLDEGELHRLASGETVLFLAERSTSSEVQGRIVDLLAKIGTN